MNGIEYFRSRTCIKITISLICTAIFFAFLVIDPVYSSDHGLPDRSILIATKEYVDAHSAPGMLFKLNITKRVGGWAMVEVIPLVDAEGAGVLLEKVKGKWVVRELGTVFESWRTKAPKELFDFSK